MLNDVSVKKKWKQIAKFDGKWKQTYPKNIVVNQLNNRLLINHCTRPLSSYQQPVTSFSVFFSLWFFFFCSAICCSLSSTRLPDIFVRTQLLRDNFGRL